MTGQRLLGQGEIVVTDRLHAHILSTLMGITQVILDDSYGKVFQFVDTWTHASKLVYKAADIAQAKGLVEALLTKD